MVLNHQQHQLQHQRKSKSSNHKIMSPTSTTQNFSDVGVSRNKRIGHSSTNVSESGSEDSFKQIDSSEKSFEENETQIQNSFSQNDSGIAEVEEIHTDNLWRKKEELLRRISQKLLVLRSEQLSLREEIALNEELGRSVGAHVHSKAKPNECVKYNLHVEEIDKITSLLLSLSGRLARTENELALMPQEADIDERELLENKREKLTEQLNEAKRLKENIDKRSTLVSEYLKRYLSIDQLADYHHFIKMKAKLIMDTREIADKIKLGEEQIKALQESIFFNK